MSIFKASALNRFLLFDSSTIRYFTIYKKLVNPQGRGFFAEPALFVGVFDNAFFPAAVDYYFSEYVCVTGACSAGGECLHGYAGVSASTAKNFFSAMHVRVLLYVWVYVVVGAHFRGDYAGVYIRAFGAAAGFRWDSGFAVVGAEGTFAYLRSH